MTPWTHHRERWARWAWKSNVGRDNVKGQQAGPQPLAKPFWTFCSLGLLAVDCRYLIPDGPPCRHCSGMGRSHPPEFILPGHIPQGPRSKNLFKGSARDTQILPTSSWDLSIFSVRLGVRCTFSIATLATSFTN